MPMPATKTSEICTYLGDVFHANASASEIDMARVSRDVQSVKRTNLADGLMLEGMLATLRYDRDQVFLKFDQAMNASGKSAEVAFNYGISLFAMGDMALCAELFGAVANKREAGAPSAVNYVAAAGAYREAVLLAERNGYTQSPDFPKLVQVARFLDSVGASDDDAVKAVSLAGKIAWDDGIHITGANYYAVEGGVFHGLVVPHVITDSRLLGMEWALDRACVRDDKRIQLRGFSVGYSAGEPIMGSRSASAA